MFVLIYDVLCYVSREGQSCIFLVLHTFKSGYFLYKNLFMMCYHVSQEGQSCIFPIPLNLAIFLNKNLWYFIMCSVCILSFVSQNGQSCHHTCGLAHQSTSATVPCCCTATCVTEPCLYTFLRSVTLAWLWPGTPIHLALASVLPFCTVPHGGEGRLEMSC